MNGLVRKVLKSFIAVSILLSDSLLWNITVHKSSNYTFVLENIFSFALELFSELCE